MVQLVLAQQKVAVVNTLVKVIHTVKPVMLEIKMGIVGIAVVFLVQ